MQNPAPTSAPASAQVQNPAPTSAPASAQVQNPVPTSAPASAPVQNPAPTSAPASAQNPANVINTTTNTASVSIAQRDNPSIAAPIVGPASTSPMDQASVTALSTHNQVRVTPDQATRFTSPDGRVQLEIPAGAVAQPVTITYQVLASAATDGFIPTGTFFTLTAVNAAGDTVRQFAQPLTLRVTYTEQAGINESRLGLYFTDAEHPAWTALASTVDPQSNRVVAQTDHFTTFAVMAATLNDLCDPTISPAIDPEFEATYQLAISRGEDLGCPKGDAFDWNGAKSQEFENGSRIVAGYYVGPGYIDGYVKRGGPATLGKPIEHSFDAAAAREFFRDKNVDFVGRPIQYYEYGFVGQEINTGTWKGALNFPMVCPGNATLEENVVRPPDPDNPGSFLKGTRYYTYTVTTNTYPAPGANERAKLSLVQIMPNVGGSSLGAIGMSSSGDQYTYTYSNSQPEDDTVPALTFSITATREGDGFQGYAPAINEPQTPISAPGGWACPGGINPGSGGFSPPRDTTPPDISTPDIFQDGFGGVSVETTITDNSGTVSAAYLIIDGNSTPMQPKDNNRFYATVQGLAVGTHTLQITAVDPSLNQGKWPKNGSVLVFKVEHSGVYGKVDWVGYSPDPINTLIGNFIYEYIDMVLLGAGPRMELRRFYNSQSSLIGLFGQGWTTLFDMRLIVVDNSLLSGAQLRYPDGRTANFPAEGDGFARAPYGFDQLERDGDGYLLTRTDGTRYRFRDDGRLVQILDRSDVAIDLVYSGDTLSEVRAPGGTLAFSADGEGRITQVNGPDGIAITYTYDADGQLLSVTDARKGTVTYTYDADHGLSTLTTPAGPNFLQEQRYDEQGRVVYQRVGDNFINEFTYDDVNHTTTLTDTYGYTITYRYDEDGRLIEQTDALGGTEKITYNDDNQRTSYTNRLGHSISFEYDDAGNVVKETNALGDVRSWVYDEDRNLVQATDALGRTTTYTYDANGRRTAQVDPLGGRTELRYDDQGRLIAQTNPLGATTSYKYDEQGRLIAETNPLGYTTTYEYNALGRRSAKTDALGHTWYWEYDQNGNLITETNPLGATTHYEYDANNNRIAETDPLGNVTRYEYNLLGKPVRTINPDGGDILITYDDMGNRIAETDPLGNTTRWELDELYRVVREIDAAGYVTSFTYDAEGRRITRTNALGHVTSWEYDALGRQTTETNPLGGVTKFTYDATGNRLTETRPSGATTSYTYDELDRVIAVTNPLGYITRTEYDAVGQIIAVTDALGHITRTEYDAAGQVIAITDALGNVTKHTYDALGQRIATTDALGYTTQSTFDAVGRVIAATDTLGNVTQTEYDAAGRVIAVTNALGYTTQQSYDVMGRNVTITDALGGVTYYSYDLKGQRITTTDANGHISRYEYDALGRTLAEIDPLGFRVSMIYDALGNVISRTDQAGQVTTYAYDALNRKIAETNALGYSTAFAYDADSNLILLTDALGYQTRYTYDALGQRLRITNALGYVTQYTYDALGHQVAITFADGTTNTAAYDALGRVISTTDGEGFTRSTSYDAVGNPISTTDANGNVSTTSYDALRRPIERRDAIGLIQRVAYDAVGNVVSSTDGNEHTTTLAYDALNRQVKITDAEGNTSTTAYDAVGNVLAQTDGNGHTTNHAYDARNQRVSTTDANDNTTTFTFDPVGRPLMTTDPLGVMTLNYYDAVGQLIAVTLNYNASSLPNEQTNVTTHYTFDAVGNQIAITNPKGATITFVPDALRQLVSETDPLGNTTTYSFDSVGNQIERREPNGNVIQTSYDRNRRAILITYNDGTEVAKMYDGNGNLRELHDASGVTAFTYDARDRKLSETSFYGTVASAYDGANNEISLTYPDGRVLVKSYYRNNWLKDVTTPAGQVTRYTYNGVGLVIHLDGGDGTRTTQTYDAVNNLLSVIKRKVGPNGKLLIGITYTYNAANQRTQTSYDYRDGEPRTVTETYTQDRLYRLTEMRDSAGVVVGYSYDAASNRTAWFGNDDPRTHKPFDDFNLSYQYDAADQLTRMDDSTNSTSEIYRYDANGNRIEREGSREATVYQYNAENRTAAVQNYLITGSGKRNPQDLTTMAYDGIGRRIAKTVDNHAGGGGAKTQTYAYEGLDPVAYTETWNSQHTNLYRAIGDQILAEDRYAGGDNGLQHWLTQDALGNTVALANDNGQTAKNYRYDSYGVTDEREFDSPTHINYLFGGQEHDTSTGLYHYYARDYDPETGTWLSRDPYRGTPDDPQSLHRYGYVKGNPVNLRDVLGYAAQGRDHPLASILRTLADVDLANEVESNIQAEFGREDINLLKLYNLVQKFRKSKLVSRSLLPEGLKNLPLVKDQFDPYADFSVKLSVKPEFEQQPDGIRAAVCASANGRLEAGATLRASVRVFAVDAYGAIEIEVLGCYEIFLSTIQTSIGGKPVWNSTWRGDVIATGSFGLRAYAVVDIGMTGVRSGLRFAGSLEGHWKFYPQRDTNFTAKIRLEGAPFVGYKPLKWWNWWKTEWEDTDLTTFYYDIPLT
ncbi:hypothetical protein OSCT_0233 [Oscillochloris trichoides DG-6]|uniref:YD repeat-containing protein n=1 Tax=Oscillochloris trichoides DG-6 TaxID=765420 RepID=E1IA82_9CHLR|nr:hypothetical protein OSCT_0233 [Oscillochloris trichoides DG-6]